MKRCVLYLRDEYDHSLISELQKHIEAYANMEPVHVKTEEELVLYGNSETIQSTGMVIYDGSNNGGIPTVLYRDYQYCYHIWIGKEAKSREGNTRYLHGFKSLEDVEIFLGNPDKYPAALLTYIENEEEMDAEEVHIHEPDEAELLAAEANYEAEKKEYKEEEQQEGSPLSSVEQASLKEEKIEPKQSKLLPRTGPAITELLDREQPQPYVEKSIEPSIPTQSIEYNENPLFTRSTKIQKQAFSRPIKEHQKTIGLWSPLHRMGVTTLTINFAIFLAQNRVNIAVLEGLTEKHMMKDWLKRYTAVPANWISYASALQIDTDPKKIQWYYKNAYFLPLDTEDRNYKWTPPAIEMFMESVRIFDWVVVDFPTGQVASYTEQSMMGLTELWIIVDDDFQQILSWKEYIVNLQKKLNIPFYLVFNKKMEFSQPIKLADKIGIDLLVEIPTLHEETMRNYYETKPIWETIEGKEKLEEPFTNLFKHVTGKKPEQFNDFYKEKKTNRIKDFFRSLKD